MPTYRADASTLPVVDPMDPDEALRYMMDWTAEMAALDDTVAESSWEVSPAGLSVGDGVETFASKAGTVTPAAPAIVGSSLQTQVTLYGGTAGQRYVVQNTIRTTTYNQVFSRSMLVPVLER